MDVFIVMTELYKYIDTWDGKTFFLYSVIVIAILWMFSKRQLGVNILIGIIIAIFFISYLNFQTMQASNTQADIRKLKENILVSNEKTTLDHDNVINFKFSVRDFYIYNPLEYIAMVDNLDYFFELYKLCFVDSKTAYINYDLMHQHKRNALNALHAISLKLPDDKRIVHKLNNAVIELDTILTEYLDQISYVADRHTYKYGYNIDTKIINYGVKAGNEYADMFQPFTYELQ